MAGIQRTLAELQDQLADQLYFMLDQRAPLSSDTLW
jgi:hypothetical protein